MRKEISYLQIEVVTNGPKHHFVGFNDVCPWDSSGRYILALETEFADHVPLAEDRATIGVVDFADGKRFKPVGETRAWNFQQGARVQWIPGAGNRFLIYNDRQKDRFVSVVIDVETGERNILPLPVHALNPDGHSALTLSFARLHRLYYGYGYAGLPDPAQAEKAPEGDGIYVMDLATGEHRMVLSIRQVVNSGDLTDEEKDRDHWVTHTLFNPNGTRFCFLHRWRLSDGGHYSRLLTADADGTNLCCVAEGMVSHFTWLNPRQILAWARHRPIVSRARRHGLFTLPISRWILAGARKFRRGWFRQYIIGDQYLLFTDGTKDMAVVGRDRLVEDGHMSYSPDGRWILTDTYPDEEYQHTLILYRCEDGLRIDIGKFFSPPEISFTGYRCDLHPRWNRDGTKVCIDSAHEGTRQIYLLDVEHIVRK